MPINLDPKYADQALLSLFKCFGKSLVQFTNLEWECPERIARNPRE